MTGVSAKTTLGMSFAKGNLAMLSWYSLRAEVRRIRQYAGEHGGNIFRDVADANMREVIRKPGPFIHLP